MIEAVIIGLGVALIIRVICESFNDRIYRKDAERRQRNLLRFNHGQ